MTLRNIAFIGLQVVLCSWQPMDVGAHLFLGKNLTSHTMEWGFFISGGKLSDIHSKV